MPQLHLISSSYLLLYHFLHQSSIKHYNLNPNTLLESLDPCVQTDDEKLTEFDQRVFLRARQLLGVHKLHKTMSKPFLKIHLYSMDNHQHASSSSHPSFSQHPCTHNQVYFPHPFVSEPKAYFQQLLDLY